MKIRKSAKLSFHHVARKKYTQLQCVNVCTLVQRRRVYSVLSIMLQYKSFNPEQRSVEGRRCN